MTHAICVRCGAMKFGCLLACPSCGQPPRTARQRVYSYYFSDHYLDPAELQRLSQDVTVNRIALPSFTAADEARLMADFHIHASADEPDETDVLGPPHPEG